MSNKREVKDGLYYLNSDGKPDNTDIHAPILEEHEGDSSISAEYVKGASAPIQSLFKQVMSSGHVNTLKRNPYHDALGRFTTRDNASSSSAGGSLVITTVDGLKFHSTGSRVLDDLVGKMPADVISMSNMFTGTVRTDYFLEKGFSKSEFDKYNQMLLNHTRDASQVDADKDIQTALDGGNPRYLEFLTARADAEESLMRAHDDLLEAKLEYSRKKSLDEFLRDVKLGFSMYDPAYDGPDPSEYWNTRYGYKYDFDPDKLYRNKVVYRQGGLDKNIISTSTDSRGANTSVLGTGARITPDHSWTVSSLGSKGYRVMAGLTGLYGYPGENEVLFIKMPGATFKSSILSHHPEVFEESKKCGLSKANPYHDALGRFTTRDNASSSSDTPVSSRPASELADKYNQITMTEDELIHKAFEGDEKRIKALNDKMLELRQDIVDKKMTNIVHSVNGDGTGGYTPERTELHAEIINHYMERMQDYIPEDGVPTLTVLGGRGGSGKSNFDKSSNEEFGVYDRKTSLVVDSDEIKALLPEYDPTKAYLVHDESSYIADSIVMMASYMRANVVLDITLKSDHTDKVLEFRDRGYKVSANFMHLPPEVAVVNALHRSEKSLTTHNPVTGAKRSFEHGRLVPPGVVLSNVNNEKNFDKLIPLADSWSVVRNKATTGGFNGELVARGTNVIKSAKKSLDVVYSGKRRPAFVVEEGESGIEPVTSICSLCKHFDGIKTWTCKAFPDGIPVKYMVGAELHITSSGISFEPRTSEDGDS